MGWKGGFWCVFLSVGGSGTQAGGCFGVSWLVAVSEEESLLEIGEIKKSLKWVGEPLFID